MRLTVKDLREIAASARIKLHENEITALADDLNEIILSLEPITKYELEGIEPTFHPIAGLSNVMREDVVTPGFAHEEAMVNASATQEGQYKIPPILGESGGDR